jgi:hypothetical protein
MNRHQRRAAAARGHRGGAGGGSNPQTGYQHRLAAATRVVSMTPGAVTNIHVAHDDFCGVFHGRACDCVPDITFHNPDGTKDIVNVDGSVTRAGGLA